MKLPQPGKGLGGAAGRTVNLHAALAAVREQGCSHAPRGRAERQVESISHDLRTPLTAIVGCQRFWMKGHGRRYARVLHRSRHKQPTRCTAADESPDSTSCLSTHNGCAPWRTRNR